MLHKIHSTRGENNVALDFKVITQLCFVPCIDNMKRGTSTEKMVYGDIVKDNDVNFVAKSLQYDMFLTLDAS